MLLRSLSKKSSNGWAFSYLDGIIETYYTITRF